MRIIRLLFPALLLPVILFGMAGAADARAIFRDRPDLTPDQYESFVKDTLPLRQRLEYKQAEWNVLFRKGVTRDDAQVQALEREIAELEAKLAGVDAEWRAKGSGGYLSYGDDGYGVSSIPCAGARYRHDSFYPGRRNVSPCAYRRNGPGCY